MYSNLKYLSLVVSASLVLISCGGGGGSGEPSTPPAPPTQPNPPTTTPDPVNLESRFGQYLSDLADSHIIPRYTNFASSASALQTNIESFCDESNPSQANLESVQQAWQDLSLSWQAIQWIKVGEVVENNNLFRIQFWPDSNDAVFRGVENLLLDANEVTVETVFGQNVGGQGIPALEYLLYPDDPENSLVDAQDQAKRCEVITAISTNVSNVSESIALAWQSNGGNFREQLVSGTGNFSSIQDSVEELVTNWLEALEIVKDEKMLFPLGTTAPGVIQITEHFRSDTSLASIETNLKSFKDLYTNGEGLGFDSILSDTLEQDTIAQQMLVAIDKSISDIETLNASFDSYADALNDESGRAQIATLVDDIRDIRDILSAGFIQALDISIGFNSNDGD